MRRDPYREAARWWVRMGGRPLAEAETDAFQRWLAESPDHAAAWADAELAWSLAGPASAGKVAEPPRRARAHVWRMAAALVGAIVLVAAGVELAGQRLGRPPVATAMLETAPGEIRRVKLSDGSLLTLDADSALSVRMGPSDRRLDLRRGRAHFEVAHDTRRPFKVTAGPTTVVATGTSFDVNRLPGAVDVVLLRGGVDVSAAGRTVRLRPGEHVVTGPAGELRPMQVDADAAAGWLQGRLSFHDESLADIAAQMNRYGGPRVVIGDPKLAQKRFSGVFMAGDGAALAETLRAARIGLPTPRPDGTIIVGAFPSR